MEREENEHRVDLTPSEKVEIAKRIEEAVSGRQGGDRKSKDKILPLDKQPQGKSSDIAAKAVDMNRETYRQAKTVVESGDQEIIRKMDSGEKSINAALVFNCGMSTVRSNSFRCTPSDLHHLHHRKINANMGK